MRQKKRNAIVVAAGVFCVLAPFAFGAEGLLPDNDVLMGALVDEQARAASDLVLDGLPRPYFIEYRAQDRLFYTMSASYGGLLQFDRNRSRQFRSRVRVGSFELDNTNVGGGGGGASLPIDDDLLALRHAIWLATDRDYKSAVEILTRKQAYLQDKTIEDRPDDFTPAEPVQVIEPAAEVVFNGDLWTRHVKTLSARFENYPRILDSKVSIFAGAVNDYLVNTEGTRLRVADTGMLLSIEARLQAEEGMWLTDGLEYLGEQPDQLPTVDKILADIDELCKKLIALAEAPMMEHYSGPVLFEPAAAAKAFATLLADGLCARPISLGRRGHADDSFEKKLGRRILPRSFVVFDDPGPTRFENTLLAGAYQYDDEAVPGSRVSLVEKGVLQGMLASRTPSKKVKGSNGHGRSGGLGDAQAGVGCLYIADENGMSEDELKAELIQAAKDEGLEYGLRVAALEAGGRSLGSPIYAYKVYVEDGREELVRGLEFAPVETNALKRILAGGIDRAVYNSATGVASSVISPAVIFEDIELTKFQEEFEKRPILDPPAVRTAGATALKRTDPAGDSMGGASFAQ